MLILPEPLPRVVEQHPEKKFVLQFRKSGPVSRRKLKEYAAPWISQIEQAYPGKVLETFLYCEHSRIIDTKRPGLIEAGSCAHEHDCILVGVNRPRGPHA